MTEQEHDDDPDRDHGSYYGEDDESEGEGIDGQDSNSGESTAQGDVSDGETPEGGVDMATMYRLSQLMRECDMTPREAMTYHVVHDRGIPARLLEDEDSLLHTGKSGWRNSRINAEKKFDAQEGDDG